MYKRQVYINQEWLTVCSVGWTRLNTMTACEQLGFPDGQSMYIMNQTSYHRRIGVSNIQCTTNHTSLLQCSHDPLFQIDSNCDHRHDVFLRCLCDDCNDYIPRDNVRLIDGTSISGRLEVFHLESHWGTVCSTGWTTTNTQVVCRQLGFIDEAGDYSSNFNQTFSFVLYRVNCSGDERSLFDCAYSTMSTENCNDPVYVRCQCSDCPELLSQSPQQIDAMTRSSAVFKWHLKRNISAFQILFLSQKNPEILLQVEDGKAMEENTRFKHRIQLTNDDNGTVGFNLTDITVADMGIYCLYVPNLLFDSKAILIVTDFAVVPDREVHRQVHDSVVLSWNLTSLRKLRDIEHEFNSQLQQLDEFHSTTTTCTG